MEKNQKRCDCESGLQRIEYNAEPTYARAKPYQISVNGEEVIIELDIAIQSMKINDNSQFIIQPMYAYG